jgi:hypothetical protein
MPPIQSITYPRVVIPLAFFHPCLLRFLLPSFLPSIHPSSFHSPTQQLYINHVRGVQTPYTIPCHIRLPTDSANTLNPYTSFTFHFFSSHPRTYQHSLLTCPFRNCPCLPRFPLPASRFPIPSTTYMQYVFFFCITALDSVLHNSTYGATSSKSGHRDRVILQYSGFTCTHRGARLPRCRTRVWIVGLWVVG